MKKSRFPKELLVALVASAIIAIPLGCGEDVVSLTVKSPSAGKQTSSSVERFVGTVTNNDATVTVNGSPAYIADNKFIGFANLVPGENMVEIKTELNGKAYTTQIPMTFIPPLSVSLFLPLGKPNTDFRATPFPITGYVSDSHAELTVNGNRVPVQGDGTFSTGINLGEGGGEVSAVAVSGNQRDEMKLTVPLDSQGFYTMSPYSTGYDDYRAKMTVPSRVIVNRGESMVLEWSLDTNKSIRNTGTCTVSATNESPSNISATIGPLPLGLTVEPLPNLSTVYSNSTYSMNIIIKTSKDLQPGTYAFYMNVNIQGSNDSFKGSQRVQLEIK